MNTKSLILGLAFATIGFAGNVMAQQQELDCGAGEIEKKIPAKTYSLVTEMPGDRAAARMCTNDPVAPITVAELSALVKCPDACPTLQVVGQTHEDLKCSTTGCKTGGIDVDLGDSDHPNVVPADNSEWIKECVALSLAGLPGGGTDEQKDAAQKDCEKKAKQRGSADTDPQWGICGAKRSEGNLVIKVTCKGSPRRVIISQAPGAQDEINHLLMDPEIVDMLGEYFSE